MDRAWDVDLVLAPLTIYNVRFYHRPAERTAIEQAAINWMATYQLVGIH